ncbi:inositol monophosphatase family protein [Streptosporangium pseudovulgare]|uniref:inositol-phosphate phosphatase n=1 Tax=Streptosporangium pseudovulgare TaxID=35765 RepID=A0ABQ2RHE3_9ACTN|nr:inositol monophosphatase family protein [Streptosporangium pseudovulgare]GGQ26766.1 inositol phosphatase [Streptosporangium pseudovulgare]
MDLSTSRELCDVAAEAARAVGERLRKAFRSRPEVETKRDFHDPVTEHDRAAEETIREIISRRFPDSMIIGEEGGTTGSGEPRWYVDPIDGTANFAAGLPFFCVSVAAAVGEEPVAGVVYDPVRDDEFRADLGGAWCNGVRLHSRGAAGDREAMLLSGYPTAGDLAADRAGSLDRFGRMLEAFASVRRPGSAALHLAHVAAGWADVAYGSGVKPWDVAAGVLLIRQAGGVYLPLGDSLFAPGGYLAHVGGFDLAGSVMAEVCRPEPGTSY